MPLDEFLVILFGLCVVFIVEFSPKILLGRLFVLFLAVGKSFGTNQNEWEAGRYLSAGFPLSTASPPPPCSPTVPRLGFGVRYSVQY